MFLVNQSIAQLNNSWIDYSKTYYKFKLAENKLCRISQSTLAAAGISTANPKYFQLFRNGEEIRLYTSTTTAFGANDFIEFWGQMNDGKPDNQLYRNPDFQLADKYSLETDTCSYFLTLTTSNSNLRYSSRSNPAPAVNRLPETYFMRTIGYYYKNLIHSGEAKYVGEYVTSSSYDKGEGWASNPITPANPLTYQFQNLFLNTDGPSDSISVSVNMAGAALGNRSVSVKLFDTDITDNSFGVPPIDIANFEYSKTKISSLPSYLLFDPTYVPVTVSSTSDNVNDRLVVSSISIRYPAMFNFCNATNFEFTLPEKDSAEYLEIENFNFGTLPPILYDETNGDRYVGDISSTPGLIKFVLYNGTGSNRPSSRVRNFMLISQENPKLINGLVRRNFLNFNSQANQADYLIISNPLLNISGTGAKYLDSFRLYRNSVKGGGFTAKIFDINELTDQFGFGIINHPGSIRDFIRYADAAFTVKPQYAFIIGRGLDYMSMQNNKDNPIAQQLNLVPTFGNPPSDNLLVSPPGICNPLLPVGRLGAINANEVRNYYLKVKAYEAAQQDSSATVENKIWMKNFVHVVGGKDNAESELFKGYMNGYKNIAEDVAMGAHVETFTKTSSGPVQQLSGNRIEELFNEGLSFIDYFGHSSANNLEFNLNNPENYRNQGKYPFFNVSGCNAGNYFVFDPMRINGNLTLSEKYVLASQCGSIGFLADTHFGIPPYLNNFNSLLYQAFSRSMYGNSIGNQIDSVISLSGGADSDLDFYTRIHLEEINLQGDPAIKINSFSKPDFVVEDRSVVISPSTISLADSNFNVDIQVQNIGKAIEGSMVLSVIQKLPNDSVKILYRQLIPCISNTQNISLSVSIDPIKDKGLNKIIVSVDDSSQVDESIETNNTITKQFYIFDDDIRPIFPQNYGIVNFSNPTFAASTAKAIAQPRIFVMEIDTSGLFNSPLKRTYNKTSIGGLIEFSPDGFTFTNNTVYYWRVTVVPNNDSPYIWNSFSFIYLQGSSPGYNQSGYYQHLKSAYQGINLLADRKYYFEKIPRKLTVRTGLFPYYNYDHIDVSLDLNRVEEYGCIDYADPIGYNNLQFYLFDSLTLSPWQNHNVTGTSGLYSSNYVCPNGVDSSRAFFEFNYAIQDQRKNAIDFIDSIPVGTYVAITNLGRTINTSFINQWKADTAALGSGNSLYHKLKSIGFNKIDSFYKNLPFLYFFKKGDIDFPTTQVIGPKDSSYIEKTILLNSASSQGTIQSPIFGPAQSWTSFTWDGVSIDPQVNADNVNIELWGIRSDGNTELLSNINTIGLTDLDFVDAAIFPYIKVVMKNKDSIFYSPNQLNFFRFNAVPAPEGAIAPGIFYLSKDTLQQGEPVNFKIAFKNVSQTPFDSLMKVKFEIHDRYNVLHTINVSPRKSLVPGDTLLVDIALDSIGLMANNNLFIEFNPDNDQSEQYHFNNVLSKDFFIKKDIYNPFLDVTFDGVHILNRDIVASKPHILAKLKDENQYLSLSDTGSINLKLRYPDQTIHEFSFGDTMKFTPSNPADKENVATVDFYPYLPQDGEYELIVSGKDSSGNRAGVSDYRVLFTVINKPMISNLFNYPNPFTTSTAFVFTITGSEVPQNIRIQILTITGKVVKEITKAELGASLHVGRNITDYKWDGTDMNGQKLANGVYLYRVLTSHKGSTLEKYSTYYDDTDKYFNKGYGKMYLMR